MANASQLSYALLGPALLLCLHLACGAGAGKDGTNGTNGTNGTVNVALVLPTAAITLDGAVTDWEGISPLATSIQGNGSPTHVGSDVKALYVARDASHLYLRMDLWDGASTAFWNGTQPNDGCYRFLINSNVNAAVELGVAYGGYGVLPYPNQWSMGYNGSNSASASAALQGPGLVSVGTNTIECAVPLADLGNPSAFYGFQGRTVSVSTAGTGATQLDIAQIGQPQKVCIEGIVRAAGTGAVIPIHGAVVSTSLDGQTITTDAAGHFFLQTTAAPNYASTPYTITITAAGYTTYSLSAIWGDHPVGQSFTLAP
ncbi:MAG TPA: carboxypeptidase-like regulatory domain-containing protein [Geothrix sp.]|nr:carboxypeptidase-like regulatory domain-containing protein [Geothrix sp.]